MAYTTINKSSDFFNTKLYTGNSGTQAITGVGFQPDLVWTKGRNQSESHYWTDAVRGTNSQIYSNGSNAQGTASNVITAFGTDGFTLGNNSEVNGGYNYASWNWKAGTGQGSSNTDGSINTTYTSVNTTAGFSISKYTGNGSATATIGHGLGVAPSMIISKNLSTSSQADWCVYHKNLTTDKNLFLNLTSAESTPSYGTINAPTNSLINVTKQSGNQTNSAHDFIMYCFAEKTGYNKFGSYTGNGNADGTFIYTGFKPAFVLVKPSSSTGYWSMTDNKRVGYNSDNKRLYPNAADAEESQAYDLFSNGFKVTNTSGTNNGSGTTYIYMAFGQSIVGSNNVPANAR